MYIRVLFNNKTVIMLVDKNSKDNIIVRQSQMERAVEIMSILNKEGVRFQLYHLFKLHKFLCDYIWEDKITNDVKKFDMWTLSEIKEYVLDENTK